MIDLIYILFLPVFVSVLLLVIELLRYFKWQIDEAINAVHDTRGEIKSIHGLIKAGYKTKIILEKLQFSESFLTNKLKWLESLKSKNKVEDKKE